MGAFHRFEQYLFVHVIAIVAEAIENAAEILSSQ